MASFVNHKSRVRVLQAKLTAFARELDETLVVASQTPASTRQDQADAVIRSHDFLRQQGDRLRTVEQNLLQATDYILPREEASLPSADDEPSGGQMTVTELTQMMRLLQELQSCQISRLEELVGLKQQKSEPEYEYEQPTPIQPLAPFGRPLDAVVETDHETDASRATPTSTMSFGSPNYADGTIGSLTPQTPSVQDLRLSASTVSILQRASIQSDLESPPISYEESTAESLLIPRAQVQDQDADDEASVSSQETSSSDEDADESFEGRTVATVPTVVAAGRIPRPQQSGSENPLDDDGDTCDDSAMYCPTVVASDRIPKQGNTLDEFMHHTRNTTSPPDGPRFSHIEVDMGIMSPTPTNLTMDTVAFLNETVGQLDTVFENGGDNASVASDETPVLDRYRIDRDDESPNGFRVVPNKRGTRSHSRSPHVRTPGPKSAKKKNRTSPLIASSPNVTPRASRQPRRVFRKTPYPKKKIPSTPTIDENTPFDANVSKSAVSSPSPPAASLKLERTRLSYPVSQQEERSQPVTPLFLSGDTTRSTSKPGSLYSTGIVIPPLATTTTRALQTDEPRLRIRPLTLSEYENGPRVVKMQVSFEEADSATTALNAALQQYKGSKSTTLAQSQAYRILQPLGFEERKCRSILMTLCHFRRLMMQRHSLSGEKTDCIVFEIQSS